MSEMKVCKTCGIEKPLDTSHFNHRDGRPNPHCKECVNEKARQKRKDDPEKSRETSQRYRDKHPNKHKDYYERNKEKILARTAEYAKAHPEQRRQIYRRYNSQEHAKQLRKRRYYDNHADVLATLSARRKQKPEIQARAMRKWRAAHPDEWKAVAHKRRARERDAGGSFTGTQWSLLKAMYGNRCLKCGRLEPDISLEPDHIKPIAIGGTGFIFNIQPLCRSCNASKGARFIDYRHIGKVCNG